MSQQLRGPTWLLERSELFPEDIVAGYSSYSRHADENQEKKQSGTFLLLTSRALYGLKLEIEKSGDPETGPNYGSGKMAIVPISRLQGLEITWSDEHDSRNTDILNVRGYSATIRLERDFQPFGETIHLPLNKEDDRSRLEASRAAREFVEALQAALVR